MNAGQFRPGQNSHTGEVFRRGEDQLPRGSVKLMLAVAALDTRLARYENLCRIHRGEAGALAFLKLQELTADRLEGKPTQHIVADHRRSTTFVLEGQPVTPDEAQAAVPEASTPAPRADLTMLPPGLPADGSVPMEPLA